MSASSNQVTRSYRYPDGVTYAQQGRDPRACMLGTDLHRRLGGKHEASLHERCQASVTALNKFWRRTADRTAVPQALRHIFRCSGSVSAYKRHVVHDSCQETHLFRGEGQFVQLRGVGRSSRAFSADKERVVGGMKRNSLANAMHRWPRTFHTEAGRRSFMPGLALASIALQCRRKSHFDWQPMCFTWNTPM